jgi:hypothetical protein
MTTQAPESVPTYPNMAESTPADRHRVAENSQICMDHPGHPRQTIARRAQRLGVMAKGRMAIKPDTRNAPQTR